MIFGVVCVRNRAAPDYLSDFLFTMLLWRLAVWLAMHAKDLAGALICCGIRASGSSDSARPLEWWYQYHPHLGITLCLLPQYLELRQCFFLEIGLAMIFEM